jgi:hypothetical protein
MPQHGNLGVLGRLPAGQQRDPSGELTEDEAEQLSRHDGGSSPTSTIDAKSQVKVMDEVFGTHTSPGVAGIGKLRNGVVTSMHLGWALVLMLYAPRTSLRACVRLEAIN